MTDTVAERAVVPVVGATDRAAAGWVAADPLDQAPRPPGRRLTASSFALAGATAAVLALAVDGLARAHRIGATLAGGWVTLTGPLLVAVVVGVTLCEVRWPAERRAGPGRGRVHDGLWFVVHVAAVVPVMTLLGVGFARLLAPVAPLVRPGWDATWPSWAVVGLGVAAMDAANWVAHVADHKVRALWRLHAVHHTQEEVSALTAFRAHPLSHLVGFGLATASGVVVLGDRAMLAVAITVYICLNTVSHANVTWNFGPLGAVLVSPAYHRLHHAADGEGNANFGIVFTLWDVAARTAVFPAQARAERAVATGLPARQGRALPVEQAGPDGAPPRHFGVLVAQLVEPFVDPVAGPARRRRRTARPRLAGTTVAATAVLVGLGLLGWLAAAGATGRSASVDIAQREVQLIGPVIVGFVVVVMALEHFWPAQRRALGARGHRQDALYLGLYVVAVVPMVCLTLVGLGAVMHREAPWLVVPPARALPVWALTLVGLAVMDLANWAAHLANHKVGPLWRLHAVHHSQEELSVLTSFRAHPLVHVTFLATTVPVVVLGANGAVPAGLVTAYVCLSALPHANVDWGFGPLGRVLVSPRYHRRHHATGGRLDVNLGVVLTLWDVLSRRAEFGAAASGGRPAVIETGLGGRPIEVEQEGVRARHWHRLAVQLAEPYRATGAARRAAVVALDPPVPVGVGAGAAASETDGRAA